MLRILASAMFFVLAACWLAVAQTPQGPLTNADVVKMVKAGISSETIEMAIGKNGGKFDTSAAGLLSLREQGVPDRLLQAMMKSGFWDGSQTQTSSAPQLASSASSRSSDLSVLLGEVPKESGLYRVEVQAWVGSRGLQVVRTPDGSRLAIGDAIADVIIPGMQGESTPTPADFYRVASQCVPNCLVSTGDGTAIGRAKWSSSVMAGPPSNSGFTLNPSCGLPNNPTEYMCWEDHMSKNRYVVDRQADLAEVLGSVASGTKVPVPNAGATRPASGTEHAAPPSTEGTLNVSRQGTPNTLRGVEVTTVPLTHQLAGMFGMATWKTATAVKITGLESGSDVMRAGIHVGDFVWGFGADGGNGAAHVQTAEKFWQASQKCTPACLISVYHVEPGKRNGFVGVGPIETIFTPIYRSGTGTVIGYRSKATGFVYSNSTQQNDREITTREAFGSDLRKRKPAPGTTLIETDDIGHVLVFVINARGGGDIYGPPGMPAAPRR